MKKKIIQTMAFFLRELDMRKRSFMWQIVWIVYDLMWAMSVGFLGLGVASISGAEINTNQYVLYLLVGSFMWTYLSSVFSIVSWAITWERWEGTIEYTFMAPVKRIFHLVGNSIFAIIYGLIRMVIVFLISSAVFDLNLQNANLFAAGFILILASISFVGFGMMAAVLPLISPENGEKTTMIVEAILMMVSGIFYPITILPIWMQPIARLSPATYALEAMRKAIVEHASIGSLWGLIWPLIITGIVLIPLGNFVFKLGEQYVKRVGKLKRDG
ncbi:MAG: ABC transporter permease [Nanoarchaeota archaeon]|nr:ABC transporter permease [Nanoarchaeota archaeon]MBU1030444.1 ABC transporter permease [Nanoarchaeota archaeon]MBU1849773.1 ABC transporter permease [Nanoarchaeota archaeon]